jgi:acyl phosphate:glycerol-3-phosphate acyltransferase
MDGNWSFSLLAMGVSYLCGSIPTSVWWGKAFFDVDIREHGSHNAGATNTFRVLGPRAGIPVLLIDIAKGFLPVRVLPNFSSMEVNSDDWMWLRVGLVLAAVIGHLYPVFAKFKGGKGVATSLGGLLAVHPGAAVICIGVFAVVFAWRKYVSLASLTAALAFPISMLLVWHETNEVKIGFSIVLCLIVFWTHRTNIGRLMRGEENRMKLSTRVS